MTAAVKTEVRLRLTEENARRLYELAQEAEMAPSALARDLLAELLPTIKTVRRRLQVVRNGDPGS